MLEGDSQEECYWLNQKAKFAGVVSIIVSNVA